MTGSGGGAQGHSHVSATGAEYGCQSDLTAGLPEPVLKLGLNLQAWRIPLWETPRRITPRPHHIWSQPPSLENPFVGVEMDLQMLRILRLNLQAWRIPLWVLGASGIGKTSQIRWSQPPSLENPFVGNHRPWTKCGNLAVSTSKPGESLCGLHREKRQQMASYSLNLQAWRIPLWGRVHRLSHFVNDSFCLNLQAWRIPLWVI